MIRASLTILMAVWGYMSGWFLLAWCGAGTIWLDIAWGGGFIVAALTAVLLPVRPGAPRPFGGPPGDPLGLAAGGAHRPA